MNGKNIYQRISDVSALVKNIEKNMTVGTGGSSYKAVSDFDVVLAVKAAEREAGVCSFPVSQELIDTQVVESTDKYGNKKANFVDVVKMVLRAVNVDDPTDFVEIEAYGRGIDPADKGFGKAATYARKYCLLGLYKIATGEDPDKDASEDIARGAVKPVETEAQAQEDAPKLEDAIKEAKKAKTLEQVKKVCDKYRSAYGSNKEFVKVVNEVAAKINAKANADESK